MSFDVAKLAQSMQKLSQTMLQGSLLFAANDMRKQGGMCAPSIWGGGFGFGCGCGMPSPNIYHPMYSGGYTDPLLLQQGIMDARAYGAQEYQRIRAQLEAQQQPTQQTRTETPDQTLSQEFENDLATKGEHTFVTEKWIETNNKEAATEDEMEELAIGYFKGIGGLSVSHLSSIDEKYGNNKTDEKLTLDEFTNFAKDKFGEKATDEKIALAFARLDVDKNNSITREEMTAAFTVIDEITEDRDGKITQDEYNKFTAALGDENSNVGELLKTEYANYFGNDKIK